MSSPSKPEHTDSRVDAAVSLEHASGSLGDCESLPCSRPSMSPARARRDYRVGRIGADKSLYSCLCQRDITLFWTMYEALLAAMLTLSRREQLFFWNQTPTVLRTH